MEFGVIVQTDITAFTGEVGRIMKNRDGKGDNASFLHHARSMHKTTMGYGRAGTHWVHLREEFFKIAFPYSLKMPHTHGIDGCDAEAGNPLKKFAKGACPEKCVASS